MKKVFFSSGLPKSGSNMIKDILSQNEAVSIYSYSPFAGALDKIKNIIWDLELVHNRDTDSFDECIKHFFNHGISGWGHGLNKKASIYIDDNRIWLTKLEDLKNIFNGKMIVFIRDLKSIINSFEYTYINKIDYSFNSLPKDFYQYQPNNKQLQRVIEFFNLYYIKTPLIGIHRIIQEKDIENFYFIKYEDFITNPKKELKNIYHFLNIQYYEHDFENIEISYKTPISHIPYGNAVKFKKIEQLNKKNLLNKESIRYIETNFKWFYDFFYKK